MKVHFGGSGIGVKSNPDNYLLIRKSIKKLGSSLTRDWLNPAVDKKTPNSEVAFQETIKAVNNSSAVILEGTHDTSSVGKQLMLALNLEIPVLILYFGSKNEESSLDDFIDKKASKLVKRSSYNQEDVYDKIKAFLDWADKNTRKVRFNLELERRLDNYLKLKAKKHNSNKSEEIRKLILDDINKHQ